MTLYGSEYCHEDPWGDELDPVETFDPELWEDMQLRFAVRTQRERKR